MKKIKSLKKALDYLWAHGLAWEEYSIGQLEKRQKKPIRVWVFADSSHPCLDELKVCSRQEVLAFANDLRELEEKEE